MGVRIINADVMDGLTQLESESVHCVVTSPPYFGLRDYGVKGQIGLEHTPDTYVTKLVEVFREVRRVLRKDGTCWLNLGDTYAGGGRGGGSDGSKQQSNAGALIGHINRGKRNSSRWGGGNIPGTGDVKPKDLFGIPWRVAFALQADGWWLRQDIIWAKPNAMPESVTDRCTKAHEYMFLLAKSERYFYDQDSIKQPAAPASFEKLKNIENQKAVYGGRNKHNGYGTRIHSGNEDHGGYLDAGVNRRSVWEVATQSFSEAHFAVFPPALIEPCIKAGCPEGGMVLDPFGGSGTTGLVADRLKRNAILIELNPEYAAMAEKRVKGDCPMFAEVTAEFIRETTEHMT